MFYWYYTLETLVLEILVFNRGGAYLLAQGGLP